MKKVKPHTVDWAQIERFLASADKKLASAHKILAPFPELSSCLCNVGDEAPGSCVFLRSRRTVRVHVGIFPLRIFEYRLELEIRWSL
jgi:hypothetical protein